MTLEYEEIMSMESLEKPKIDPRLQKAADDYVGHAAEIDEDLSVYSNRKAFIDGAKWMANYIGELIAFMAKNNPDLK